MLLEGKTAIITGASAGIGRAAALLFAREGATLVLGARRKAALEDVAGEIKQAGGRALAVPGDVKDEIYAKTLVNAARDAFGGLDIAFNNAGVMGALGPVSSISGGAWREAIDVNLTSAFYAAKYQAPAMVERGGGSIIFTSSFVGSTAAFPGVAAYAAGKAGLVGLAKALAVELGPDGVRVNALLPGGADTDMARDFADSPEALDHVRSLHALKRIAAPEEIARSALYLASDLSSFTTGSALLADGGISVSKG